MYKFDFVSDNGQVFSFDHDRGVFAEADFGASVPVKVTASQGFGQVGVTPERESVGPRTIKIKGQLRRNIPEKKARMRQVLTPLSRGWIICQGYEIRAIVQDPPIFQTNRRDGSFMMRLLCPHPWFRRQLETIQTIGTITPEFSFPVNYGAPHHFGVQSAARTVVLQNNGDVRVPFSVRISAVGGSTNLSISNLHTRHYLRLIGTLQAGDVVQIYQQDGITRAELTRGGETADILSWIDEKSDLFFLDPGPNVLTVSDNASAQNITVTLSYREEVPALYES